MTPEERVLKQQVYIRSYYVEKLKEAIEIVEDTLGKANGDPACLTYEGQCVQAVFSKIAQPIYEVYDNALRNFTEKAEVTA